MTVATRKYTYDFLVFIGRFQPFHYGHCAVIQEALRQSKHVIVLVGSANSSRRPRNPFTYAERVNMIIGSFNNAYNEGRLLINPLNDHTYNDDAWISEVQRKVDETVLNTINEGGFRNHGTNDARIGLIGMEKDGSSYYLKKFPQWSSCAVPEHSVLHATDIRKDFLRRSFVIPHDLQVPPATVQFMRNFTTHPDFPLLVDYAVQCEKYKASMYGHTPFDMMIGCSDNVVVQSGHVLLVERAANPGKGLLALPGGHVNTKDETFRSAAVRELKEETRISDGRGEIPPGKLDSMITDQYMFDDPYRSERGRVITMAYLYKLPEATELYHVRGEDDARFAKWYKIGTLDPTKMFEDHYHIIRHFLG